jgi:hypothetical protein
VFRRLKLTAAVEAELVSRNRLLPRRWDSLALASHVDDVERWLRPRLRRADIGTRADTVFADKGWRGARPLNVMAFEDRVLYRALVDLIAQSLPDRLRERVPAAEFRQAPLDVPDVAYISKTDVTAYYEFVDHELLADELVNQTGEEPAVAALDALLGKLAGRRVGLPQIHRSSDVLGDTYIDPVRRRLLRRGLAVFTYSDDFLIASATLGDARNAVEACAAEVRTLGLVLNERRTYTYATRTYRRSIGAFASAERRLFVDTEHSEADLFLLDDGYVDADADDADARETLRLGHAPLASELDEDDAVGHDGQDDHSDPADPADQARAHAAARAWTLWVEEDESEDA